MKKVIVQLLVILLPRPVRFFFLRKLIGFKIGMHSSIGFSIICADKVSIGESARIGHFNYIGRIGSFEMGNNSFIGSLNWITGISKRLTQYFTFNPDRNCEIVLAKDSSITSRHIIDCNGGVYIGEMTIIAGYRSQLLTHSIDLHISRQTVEPIIIGKYCFVSSGCIILKGARLPDYSVLGAGSVLNKKYDKQYMLYAGIPAIPKKELDNQETAYFSRVEAFVY